MKTEHEEPRIAYLYHAPDANDRNSLGHISVLQWSADALSGDTDQRWWRLIDIIREAHESDAEILGCAHRLGGRKEAIRRLMARAAELPALIAEGRSWLQRELDFVHAELARTFPSEAV
ncbi:MAG TPA: hypothetical protein VHY84_27460 [Bryobacteraceae bacterium]|nr:hypothetical protein [Bryobacteraceae bacterium]